MAAGEYVRARAPGKVILCGEHAVVHGAAAIAAAIGIYTVAEIRDPGEGCQMLRLELENVKLSLEWSVEAIRSELQMPGADPSLVRPCSAELEAALTELVGRNEIHDGAVRSGVTAFLFLYTSIIGLQPAVVVVRSEIPIGAGLGSSAAFSVSLSASLLASNNKVKQREGCDWYKVAEADAALINKWAFEAEKIMHGKPSGVDNAVSTYGNTVKYKGGKLTLLEDLPLLHFLVTNTKIGRDTKALVRGVGVLKERDPDKMSAVFEEVDSISEDFLKTLKSTAADQDPEAERKLEELITRNQALLEAMEVSHPSIREICRITSKYQLKSKLTGAGGGGCVITLLPRSVSTELLGTVTAELNKSGFECLKPAQVGCTGVQIMRSSGWTLIENS